MQKLKYNLDKTIEEYENFKDEVDVSLSLLKAFNQLGIVKFKKMFSEELLSNFWYWQDDSILSHEDFITEFCQDIVNSLGTGLHWTRGDGVGSTSLVLLFDSTKVKFYLGNAEVDHIRTKKQNLTLRNLVKKHLNSIVNKRK